MPEKGRHPGTRIYGMSTREDRSNPTEGSPDPSSGPLRGAALAVRLLEASCAQAPGDPLRLDVLQTLARDLRVEIEALAELEGRETAMIEGALRAADVANLAASALPELPESHAPEIAASAHLAAGAARALHALAEAVARAPGGRESSTLKDARGVAWRAQLAARQVDDFLFGNKG